jgi:hypothetical protein
MAYDKKKVMTYGAAGIIIAAAVVTLFLPVQEQVTLVSYVSLEQIPGYGLQFIKVSEEQADLTHLIITIEKVEVQLSNGEWVQVSGVETSWDLVKEIHKTFAMNIGVLSPGNYSRIRFVVAQGLEYSNATLSNNVTIRVNAPYSLELDVPEFTVETGVDELTLSLSLGPGVSSNQMLPQYHIAIMTVRLQAEVSHP